MFGREGWSYRCLVGRGGATDVRWEQSTTFEVVLVTPCSHYELGNLTM